MPVSDEKSTREAIQGHAAAVREQLERAGRRPPSQEALEREARKIAIKQDRDNDNKRR